MTNAIPLMQTLFPIRTVLLTAFLLSILSFTSAQSTLQGTVKNEAGEPMVSATVEIPELGKGAYANIDGIFSIPNIPAGKWEIRVTYLGMDTLRQSVEVGPGSKTIKLDLVLKESSTQLETVEIFDSQTGKIERTAAKPGITQVSSKDINLIPTLGTPDLAQYLQVVPGVVFTGDQGGQLFIRGGTPIQNMVRLDGAIIYNPFHSIGLFSVFDTDYIRNVDVYSAGFPAEFGGRISSIMDIRTRAGNFKRFSGKVHINPITAGALIEGPIPVFKSDDGRAGMSYLLSARACYLDQTSETFYNYIDEQRGLPFSFLDLYGKTTIGSGTNQVSFFGFYQQDKVAYDFPTAYEWNSWGAGTNFRFLPPSSPMIISGNFATTNYSNEQILTSERFPRYSEIGGFNSRINFSYIFNSIDELAFGMQILGFNTEYRFTDPVGLETNIGPESNTEFAGYIQYRKVFRTKINEAGTPRYFDRFVLEPSFRFHYFNDQNTVTLEPRLRGKLNFKRISFEFATGIYNQNLISLTSDRDVVVLFQGYAAAQGDLARLTDPTEIIDMDNALQQAIHYMLAVELEIVPNLATTIEGWYKDFTQLTNINRQRLFQEQRPFIQEQGQAYGADLILKYTNQNLYLYATYGWMMVERDDYTTVYNPVFDRRHTVNFIGNYGLGELRNKRNGRYIDAKWQFSVRWTLGSGFPFTQTVGFFEKIDFNESGAQSDYIKQEGQLQPILSSEFNGGRLPAFHRLDVSVKRRFLIFSQAVLELSANCVNVYDRRNIFYFDRLRGSRVDQLPVVPTLGVSFKY